MPIRTPQPPAKGLDIVRKNVPELAKLAKGVRSLAEKHLAPPHQLFTATLEDVLKRRILKAAEPASWRYLVATSKGVAAAEVASRNATLSFHSHNEGPFVLSTIEAIRRAELLDAIQQRDYELRLLSIPAVYVFALWLHADSDEILIPLDPAPIGLVAYQSYDEKAFTDALLPLARQRTEVMV